MPALLLVSLASVGMGYGIAYATKPEVAGVLSQLILFIALMFAPINYPAERLLQSTWPRSRQSGA